MCKKEFSVYFIYTLSLSFVPFLCYDALRICFLTHLVCLAQAFVSWRPGSKEARRVEAAPYSLLSHAAPAVLRDPTWPRGPSFPPIFIF
jgi:hypothetical protein